MSTVHEVKVEARCGVEWAKDAMDLKAIRQTIRGVIPACASVVCYGGAGTGKSTLAVDIGCAIATGQDWRGRRVERGLVLHVAGEGAYGLRIRLAAAIKEGHGAAGMPYGIITHALDLSQAGDLAELLELIAAAETERGERLALLILDTLARCFRIDENDGEQMGRVITACDQIRQTTGAAVMVIHHTGKDASRGMRGHSNLHGALDVEILVDGSTNPRTLTNRKQRDFAEFEPMAFDLEPVKVGTDPATLEDITACVVRHSDQPPPKAKRRGPRGRNQQRLLAALQEHKRSSGSDVISSPDLREIARAQGLRDRRRFSEVRESLERDGWLVPSVGGVRLAGDQL